MIKKLVIAFTMLALVSNGTYFKIYANNDGWNSIKDSIAVKIGSPKAIVNLEAVNIDVANRHVVPIVKNDRTLLPIRFISEKFGANVEWNSQTNTATIKYKNNVAKITLNSNQMIVNNGEIKLDVPAEIINDRVYIPLRRLAEDVLSKKVLYDSDIIILSDVEKLAIDKQFLNELDSSFKDNLSRLNYMIYYGKLDASKIETAKTYDLVILHPLAGDLTRKQVQEIRKGVNPNDPNDDVIVLGYLSVGEDLRTCSLTDQEFATDPRFKGDMTGPRVDPRGPTPDGGSLLYINSKGKASPGGGGFASYYLDDNNFDGIPDKNKYFKGAFVNAGDPAWFDVISNMTIDSKDKLPGLREILTDDFGRGLGCDGVFLDTIDTCAPNSYTNASSFNQTEFEWTAPGFSEFICKVRNTYENKYILQNRGLFFFDSRLPHYKVTTRKNIDFMMLESYRLDSNADQDFNEAFFHDNKYAYMPKIMAEANRIDGFRVLSLGYAAGDKKPSDTLLFKSQQGLPTFLEDIKEAQEIAGFNHYISDPSVTLINNFVRESSNSSDNTPPIWSSVYNSSQTWPPNAPKPRIGVQQAIPQKGGVLLNWDVALDKNKVEYNAYYQTKPFDFEGDPKLLNATKQALITNVGNGYENGVSATTYPYQFEINNLTPGETYYFVIRAVDNSLARNEDNNKVVLSAMPIN